jgi:hypothetical protein
MQEVDGNCVAQDMDYSSPLSNGNKPTDFVKYKAFLTHTYEFLLMNLSM